MFTNYQKIVFVAPRSSGKTVLMAALADAINQNPNLICPQNKDFRNARISKCPGPFNYFQFERVLDTISHHGSWPAQTLDNQAIRLELHSQGTPFNQFCHRYIRDFVDIPGERFADLLGSAKAYNAAQPTYEDWSDAVGELFPKLGDRTTAQLFQEFENSLLAENNLDPEHIVSHYRDIVLKTIFKDGDTLSDRGRYMLTPSTILSRVWSKSEDFPDAFAPLPEKTRQRNPALCFAMKQQYDAYQKKIIEPVQRQLKQADVVVIPVDIAWLLSSQPAVFNDQISLINSIGSYLDHTNGRLKNVTAFAQRLFMNEGSNGKLKKVILCATKIDLFRSSDWERAADLLAQITAHARRTTNFGGAQLEHISCAAIKAAEPHPHDSSKVVGLVNGQREEFQPSELPAEWPSNWMYNDFSFPIRFQPHIAQHRAVGMSHVNLEQLIRSIED